MTNLGPQPTWLDSRNGCSFNPIPSRAPVGNCDKPCTHHILLRSDDGYIGACEEHAPMALVHTDVEDWHVWQAWCNMPGAIWHPSSNTEDADGWCDLDGGGERPVLAARADLVLSGTATKPTGGGS